MDQRTSIVVIVVDDQRDSAADSQEQMQKIREAFDNAGKFRRGRRYRRTIQRGPRAGADA